MPVKLISHLRFLNPSLPVASLPPIKKAPSSLTSFRSISIFFRIFPFKTKTLDSLPHSNSQLTFCRFSTRRALRSGSGSKPEFNRGGRDSGHVSRSKSLIEDEAELSDWVSDLRTSSGFRGSFTSDDESDSGRRRGVGRDRDRDGDRNRGDRFPTKKRSREGFDSAPKRVRSNDMEDEGFGLGRRSGGNVSRMNGRRGGTERELGFRRDENGFRGRRRIVDDDVLEERLGSRTSRVNGKRGGGRDLGFKRDGKGLRGSIKIDEEEEDDDNNDERAGSMKGLGDFLSEEESDEVDDENDDGDFEKKAASTMGLEKGLDAKERTSSPVKSNSYLSETRFDQCAISPLSLKGIKDAGYEKMTVVQEATLPIILKGKDVLAKAKTGTGKTVAFLLPSIEVVLKSPPVDRDNKRPPILVLVICPTRELATQATTEANTLLKYHPTIGVQVVIGGTRLALEQKRMQANPCQILVATPGRLRDHIENTAGFATRLKGVKVLVLDEADHLLDMGFRKEIERIIAAVPKQRQTLLFSATVPEEVRQVSYIALKRDHEFINTVQEGAEETHAQVKQMHLIAPLDKQFSLLYALLKDHIADDVNYKVLVFCTTAMVTRLVADLLGELKLNVREIHSRKPQSYRTRVSDEFRKSKGLILVTSDVSARGVDYPDVTLVIQVGLPADREQYIHRLGRTGRKGKEGQGILLLAPWEEFFLSTVKDLPIEKAPLPSVDPDTKKQVEWALSHVDMKNKETAYQAWLGYYNSNKKVGKDKYKLVELANEFSRSMGLDNPPAIPKLILGKMGLRNIPGLRTK